MNWKFFLVVLFVFQTLRCIFKDKGLIESIRFRSVVKIHISLYSHSYRNTELIRQFILNLMANMLSSQEHVNASQLCISPER